MASTAQAQGTAVITGKVTSNSGAPIVGATVVIPSMTLGVQTSDNGVYTLTIPANRVNNQTLNVVARFIGYKPATQQVTIRTGSQSINFTLDRDVLQLDQIVVTGVAEATSSRNLTIGVAKVTADQINQVSASNPIAALEGKVAGARIAIGIGTPGSNPVVRLRGSTNLAVGGSAPLLIVDGVYTRGSLADLNADDIESIEVLKGAASANIYGSNAANGVIAITTKRGKEASGTSFSVNSRTEVGLSDVANWVPINEHHPWKMNTDGSIFLNAQGRRELDADHIVDNPFPAGTFRNQQQEWAQQGDFRNQYLNVGLRRATTNLSSSVSYENNQGVLPFTKGDIKRNFRLNVDQGLLTNLNLQLSAYYTTRVTDLPTDGSGDPFFALMQAPPDVDLAHPNGPNDTPFNPLLPVANAPNSRGNPLYSLVNRDRQLNRSRLLGSGRLTYNPLPWLTLDAGYGTDRLNTDSYNYAFRGFLSDAGVPGNGSYSSNTGKNTNSNTTLNTTVAKLFGNFRTSTRLSYLKENAATFTTNGSTTKLNIDLPTLNSGDPASTTATSTQQDTRSVSYYVTQQLDYNDRYLTQFSVRRDGSSLFGSNNRWANYYGVSGAYRLTKDITIPGVQELKLRVARGTAGLRPNFADQYETYALSGGTVSKATLGNPDLRPSLQTETEYSVSTEFLTRFSLELTRADRVTKDAFLAIPLSSAKSGGFTSQVQNAADISARTFEVGFNAAIIDGPKLSVHTSITGDRTRQFIDKLNRAAYNLVDAFGQSQGQQFFYKQGERLGVLYGARFVRDPKELLDNPANKANASFSLDNYVVNEMGYVVPKADFHTLNERPIKYVDATGNNARLKLGDVNPDYNFGWTTDVRYSNLSFHVLVDGVVGGDVYNFTKQWMFQDYRHADQDQANLPASARKPIEFYTVSLYNNNEPNSYFVENGSYAKLKELSVAYNLPARFRRAIGLGRVSNGIKLSVIGRNLVTWTNYSGADPETLAGEDFNFRLDGFRYPSVRQFTGQVQFTF